MTPSERDLEIANRIFNGFWDGIVPDYIVELRERIAHALSEARAQELSKGYELAKFHAEQIARSFYEWQEINTDGDDNELIADEIASMKFREENLNGRKHYRSR